MVRGGSSPSCTAWRLSENAPEMTAWLAMTVAIVARITTGICSALGNSRKNGSFAAPGWFSTSDAWPR